MSQHKLGTPISVIELKDKTEIRVSRQTGENINKAILNATQHIFVQIRETGETINTAEIKLIRPDVKIEYVQKPEAQIKPLTAEQQKRRNKKLIEIRKQLEASGVLPKKA